MSLGFRGGHDQGEGGCATQACVCPCAWPASSQTMKGMQVNRKRKSSVVVSAMAARFRYKGLRAFGRFHKWDAQRLVLRPEPEAWPSFGLGGDAQLGLSILPTANTSL
ncbi:hypothetical protein LIA77_10314 [Sarocladium implicatum]|nr:hypothetical protein LIA77_10314 [Sarocladium implicatum]